MFSPHPLDPDGSETVPLAKFGPEGTHIPFVQRRKRILNRVILCKRHIVLIGHPNCREKSPLLEYIEPARFSIGRVSGIYFLNAIFYEAAVWSGRNCRTKNGLTFEEIPSAGQSPQFDQIGWKRKSAAPQPSLEFLLGYRPEGEKEAWHLLRILEENKHLRSLYIEGPK
jgi:hypothetical protein